MVATGGLTSTVRKLCRLKSRRRCCTCMWCGTGRRDEGSVSGTPFNYQITTKQHSVYGLSMYMLYSDKAALSGGYAFTSVCLCPFA